ncbi:hypothetical protein PGLA_16030 [Paenibacillus glacialis]|uniref:Uncharacterized protein n=1 Tax=Paenibacillus glacialis TaxID=494026 RepID=A0A168JZK3_9BACL|nr:hypothetical protein PGLA_16030 [Paenibacillus glacialis]
MEYIRTEFKIVRVPTDLSSDLLQKIEPDLKVAHVQKKYLYNKYFGESKDYYFLYEWDYCD